jgi:hypothetical protein
MLNLWGPHEKDCSKGAERTDRARLKRGSPIQLRANSV